MGPGPKRTLGPMGPASNRPWAQALSPMGSGPKRATGPNRPWAQWALGPHGPWAQTGWAKWILFLYRYNGPGLLTTRPFFASGSFLVLFTWSAAPHLSLVSTRRSTFQLSLKKHNGFMTFSIKSQWFHNMFRYVFIGCYGQIVAIYRNRC